MLGKCCRSTEQPSCYYCMAMTDKSESLPVVFVDLSQVWSLRREENDLSASVLPIGKIARIFSSSRILGKKIPSTWLAIMDATDSSGIAFLPLPMIRPAKYLTFKRRRKRKNMLPFLFQNVQKASYSVSSVLLITSARGHTAQNELAFRG